MPRWVSAIFGIVPALIMASMALLGVLAGALDGLEVFLLPMALLGVAGLTWAHVGVARRYTLVVIALLLVGEVAMLRALVPVLEQAIHQVRPVSMARTLALYLAAGPFIVGALRLIELVRRRSAPVV